MDATPQVIDQAQYLSFRVADEEYAIDILRVREIVPFSMITKVPRTPPWIRGVILMRGQVVPVVDLAAKLGLAATTPTPATCIVIVDAALGAERVVMGVTTDAVSQVIDLGRDDIAAPPAFGTRIRPEYLLGFGKTSGHLALLLDIDKVLAADEVLAMADIATKTEDATTPEQGPVAETPAASGAEVAGHPPRQRRQSRVRPTRG